MAAPEENIKKIVSTIENATARFNKAIPGIQQDIADAVEGLVRDLDTNGNTIKVNVANLRKIADFKGKIRSIFTRAGYSDTVSEFGNAFNTVTRLMNKYFEDLSAQFKPTKLLAEIQSQSIDAAIVNLTETGLDAALIEPIQTILRTNVTTGGTVNQMAQQLRNFINNNSDGSEGALQRYTKTNTVDALNTYAGQYMDIVTSDLGLDWFMYVGTIIDTSRAWCVACVHKKYIHRSEFQQLIDGDFPEFREAGGEIYPKTGLPSGMKAGTNPGNLQALRGGWHCEHQLVGISAALVPKYLREQFES